MLAIRGISSSVSNYMVFDPAVGPWRTVSLSGFFAYDNMGNGRYFTEIFSPIYDITIIPGTEENGYNEIATARFPTGVPIKLRLLKPEYFGVNQWDEPTYKFPNFWADGLNGTGAGPGLDEPWRLIELNLANVPFTEVLVPNNGLQVLDVSGNNFLERLDCSLNQLTDATFNITNSGYAIEEAGELRRYIGTLKARSNNLTTAPFIGLANNLVYYEYDVANNKISTLHVGRNSPTILDASNQFPDDPTQGLTAHSFSDPLARPEVWRVHRNKLTSLPLGNIGVGGAWSRVWELNCSDNNLTELVFPDGPPPANYWDQGTTPGGYALRTLDVSGNSITTLDVRYVDTLLDLNASNNPLSSLTLPDKTFTTYDEAYMNDSGRIDRNSPSGGYFDENGDPIPDSITGEWFSRWWFNTPSTIQSIRDSYLYRHQRGPRKLILRNCQLTSLSNLHSVRELDISQNPLSSLGSFSGTTQLGPLPVFGSTGDGSTHWRSFGVVSGFGQFGIAGVGSNAFEQSTFDSEALNGTIVVVFRNLTASTSLANQVRTGVVYLVHRRHIEGTTPTYFLTDQVNLENYPSGGLNHVSKNPPLVTTQGITGGQVAAYRLINSVSGLTLDYPLLENLTIENCPNLSSVNLRSAGFLKKLVIRDCPNLTGTVLNAAISSTHDSWIGYTTHLTHVELVNTRATSLRTASFTSGLFSTSRQVFDVIRIQNNNGVNLGFDFPVFYRCRNGVQLNNLGNYTNLSDQNASPLRIEAALSRAGTWSFSPPLPSDSNVLSLAGCTYPLSRKASFYDPAKATAVSRGWQVIDPTFV